MANVLPFSVRCRVIAALVEGTSIRATARLVGVDKDAVMKLGVVIGLACLTLHDRLVRGVQAALLEVDEIWAYVGRHEKRLRDGDPSMWGDNYTMFAIDPTSKLIPSFLTGPRDLATATTFARDLRARIIGKPQISVDGWPHWQDAFLTAFGWAGCNLGACVKEYQTDADPRDPDRKYTPSRVKSIEKRPLLGAPHEAAISTAIAERMNLTGRMQQRRLTRLTNAYSKKRENLVAAIGLHFMHYNFVRVHEALGTAPAVAAGIAAAPWSIGDLVEAALGVAAETPEPTAPAPAPAPPSPIATIPSANAELVGLGGVDAANDNASGPAEHAAVELGEDEKEAPPTVRDPIPWGEGVAM